MVVARGEIFSLGDLAKRHGVEKNKARYVLESRGINPAGKIGGRCVYDAAADARLGEELKGVKVLGK